MKTLKFVLVGLLFVLFSCSNPDKISGWYPGTFYQEGDTITENTSTSNFEATVQIEPLTVFDVKMTLHINGETYKESWIHVKGDWPSLALEYTAAWNSQSFQILYIGGTILESSLHTLDLRFNYIIRKGNIVISGHFENDL